MLPYSEHTYKQAPFEDCSNVEYQKLLEKIQQINLSEVKEINDYTNLQKEIEGIHDCITGLEETVSRTRKDIYQRYDHIHGEIKEVPGKVDTVINMMKRNGH